jgi:hypothetical protein
MIQHPLETKNSFADISLTSHPIIVDENSSSHQRIQGHSNEVQVDSSSGGVERVFKTQVRQSLLESGVQKKRQYNKNNST